MAFFYAHSCASTSDGQIPKELRRRPPITVQFSRTLVSQYELDRKRTTRCLLPKKAGHVISIVTDVHLTRITMYPNVTKRKKVFRH
jgi:hypothetical protein